MTLTREQARAFYDRFGARQDGQHFYEDPATDELIAHARFPEAQSVVEFGCGTGRFAQTLLAHHLPECATYLGVDQSATMVALSKSRLEPFGDRAKVLQTDGEPHIPIPSESCHRFVSNYVLDLLSEADIQALLKEAHRSLQPGGLLCLVGLTNGFSPGSKIVSRVWKIVHTCFPKRVGGCRPLELHTYLFKPQWRIEYACKIAPFGIPSEVVIALKQ